MKAAEFEYMRAASVAEVCEALANGGDAERKIIAGGQTLVPLMAMRLARPAMLIDINDIDELKGIAVKDGALVIGACTRQRQVELSPEVGENLPLLAKALKFVGHTQTRNRGTVGGSIAHADPSSEIPLTALTLDATFVAQSKAGGTTFAADGFFQFAMVTGLAPDQCLTEIRFPIWNGGGRVGTGFHEVSSRRGDFAVVVAAAQVELAADGTCTRAAIAVGGAAPAQVRIRGLEDALMSTNLDPGTVRDALALVDDAIDPDSDLHATADYRRRVARVLVERAILDAKAEATA